MEDERDASWVVSRAQIEVKFDSMALDFVAGSESACIGAPSIGAQRTSWMKMRHKSSEM